MTMLRDSQLKMLWMARIEYQAVSRVNIHEHADYDQFMIVLSGDGCARIGNESIPFRENSCFLLLRGVSHGFTFDRPTTMLDFKFQIMDNALFAMMADGAVSFASSERELYDLKQWQQLALSQPTHAGQWLPFRIDVGFKGTLASLLGKTGDSVHAHISAVRRSNRAPYIAEDPVALYLQTNYADKITLTALARHFGSASSSLNTRFLAVTGMTPMEYLQEVRLEKAKQYLEFTSLPLADIAQKVGWTHTHLSKMIKERLGHNPTKYRLMRTHTNGKSIWQMQDFTNKLLS